MSTINRLYLTKGATSTGRPTANAGVAGLNSAGITSGQAVPTDVQYILGDSSIIATMGATGTTPPLVSTVTLKIHVAAMDSGATGRIVVWEVPGSAVSVAKPTSVAGAVPLFVAHIQGGLGTSNYPNSTCAGASTTVGSGNVAAFDEVISIPWYDIPDALFGAAAGATSSWYATQFVTENDTTLTSGIFFEAWLEY